MNERNNKLEKQKWNRIQLLNITSWNQTYIKCFVVWSSVHWYLNTWRFFLQITVENACVQFSVIHSRHKDSNICLAIMKVNIQQEWPLCHVCICRNVPRKLWKLGIIGFCFVLRVPTVPWEHIERIKRKECEWKIWFI